MFIESLLAEKGLLLRGGCDPGNDLGILTGIHKRAHELRLEVKHLANPKKRTDAVVFTQEPMLSGLAVSSLVSPAFRRFISGIFDGLFEDGSP